MHEHDTNQAEWENPDNWSGPRWLAVYFSKKDTRTVVPKRIPALGWTVNLGRTAGVMVLLGILVAIPLAVAIVVAVSPAR